MAIHPKYQALGEKIHQHRLEQLKQIHPMSDHETNEFRSDLDEKKSQLSFLFSKNPQGELDVFQNYDSENRYIEWSLYSSDGEFLLQFGFSLNEVAYTLHSVNPDLLQSQSHAAKFLPVVRERLKRHPKALEFLNLYLQQNLAL